MMLILMEGNTAIINKWQVTIRYLESRNHHIIFSSDLNNNNPLVCKAVNVLNYVTRSKIVQQITLHVHQNSPDLGIKVCGLD